MDCKQVDTQIIRLSTNGGLRRRQRLLGYTGVHRG